MADDVVVNVEDTPAAETVVEEAAAVETAAVEEAEPDQEELWPEVRAALLSGAEAARNQADALSRMQAELEALRNRLPENFQEILATQQQTIQTLIAEALATVRTNLSTRKPDEPEIVVQPAENGEGDRPVLETKTEEPAAPQPEKPSRKRRRI